MYDSACRDFQKRMHFLVSDMLLTWLRLSPISTADVDLIRLGFLVLLLCSGLASSRGCNQLNKQFLISTPHQFSSSLFRRNLSRRLLLLAVMSVQYTFINATINLISVFFFFFFFNICGVRAPLGRYHFLVDSSGDNNGRSDFVGSDISYYVRVNFFEISN